MSMNILFFERIDRVFYPILRRCLRGNVQAYCFQIGEHFATRLKEDLDNGRVVDASALSFEYPAVYRQAACHAHENVDRLFDRYLAASRSIKCIQGLFRWSAMADMYKYRLLRELEAAYRLELKINRIVAARHPGGRARFYPSQFAEVHTDEKTLLTAGIEVVGARGTRRWLEGIVARARIAARIIRYPLMGFLRMVRGVTRHKERHEFRVGISVHYPARLHGMNYWFLETFLVDDAELPKSEVLFIDERGRRHVDIGQGPGIDAPNESDYQARGYSYVNMPDLRGVVISAELLVQTILRRLIPVWLRMAFRALVESPLVATTNLVILCDYVTWSVFADSYKLRHYVRALNLDNLSKLRILAQHGVETWFVYNDNSSTEYQSDDGNRPDHTYYSFTHYDNIAVYGTMTERFLRRHRNEARYVQTGVVTAQLVRELEAGKLSSPLPGILRRKGFPTRRVAVFDTAFLDYGHMKPADGVRFGLDMLRLLDEMPDVGMIFKASRWRGGIPELEEIYRGLEEHERCALFYRWDESGVSAVEVIAEAELVISATFVSTMAEALAAGKRAIYYDPSGHFRGDEFYWNRIPNLVAHDYEELRSLVQYWLDEVPREEFDALIEKYLRAEMDPYLDGKGLTRLRGLLRQ